MTRDEFIIYIESIGFKITEKKFLYKYKHCTICIWQNIYDIYNFGWNRGISYNDLTQLEKVFKKELRSIKLKKILG